MAYQWFKFYGSEYLSDPKMGGLSVFERSCWITLLCYASLTNGEIEYLTEEKLMIQSGVNPMNEEWEQTKGVLNHFEKLKMIHIFVDGKINVLNWKKRQESNLTGYERVKKYREKKRNDNTMITQTITTDKNRIDKNRIDKNRIDISKSDKPTEPFVLKDKLTIMFKKGGKDKILAYYFQDENFENSQQLSTAYRRHCKDAKELAESGYSEEQILEAFDYCRKNYKDINWTLRTVIKTLVAMK